MNTADRDGDFRDEDRRVEDQLGTRDAAHDQHTTRADNISNEEHGRREHKETDDQRDRAQRDRVCFPTDVDIDLAKLREDNERRNEERVATPHQRRVASPYDRGPPEQARGDGRDAGEAQDAPGTHRGRNAGFWSRGLDGGHGVPFR